MFNFAPASCTVSVPIANYWKFEPSARVPARLPVHRTERAVRVRSRADTGPGAESTMPAVLGQIGAQDAKSVLLSRSSNASRFFGAHTPMP